ncbi:lytic transglycosylase domain-containing protein [Rhodanobacter denitrificans]|uniref:lytic transglycosylase domain-containing protein n=1 Tax=Rhodanobacter denitrificans TaxID=666685 RepID=UPI001F164879|nr:lytic transglycosylase domain-containing protein [Rhodanobacter denitrificans]UJJ60651.1 lytic transglycosylase domain-containing protein [Rhodanobacter denitrificans]
MNAKTRSTLAMAIGLLGAAVTAHVHADGGAIRTISLGEPAAAAQGAGRLEPVVVRVAKPAKSPRSNSSRALPEDDPHVRECVAKATAAFDIEPMPLYLILDVEGGEVGKNSRPNRNGTYDIGKAQINSSHLRNLAARGISEDLLRDDLCVNILVQGWLYKDGLLRSKSPAKAIALYHSPNPAMQRIYLEKIDQAIARRVSRLAATP